MLSLYQLKLPHHSASSAGASSPEALFRFNGYTSNTAYILESAFIAEALESVFLFLGSGAGGPFFAVHLSLSPM